jgi:hypothetical protein
VTSRFVKLVLLAAFAPTLVFAQGQRNAPTPARPAGERLAIVVQAPDSPVRLDRAIILSAAGAPPVILYAATSTTSDPLDQFTVIVFVFDAQGTLKARHIAPGRRELNPGETKYSTIVLDGAPVDPTDVLVVGVNQAQRVDSETWWRAELEAAAEATQRKKP